MTPEHKKIINDRALNYFYECGGTSDRAAHGAMGHFQDGANFGYNLATEAQSSEFKARGELINVLKHVILGNAEECAQLESALKVADDALEAHADNPDGIPNTAMKTLQTIRSIRGDKSEQTEFYSKIWKQARTIRTVSGEDKG